jgi:hypothetical protein
MNLSKSIELNQAPVNNSLVLPSTDTFLPSLQSITEAFHLPRTVLAGERQIQKAWRDLPDLLTQIPPALRNESMARMCVAVSVGLFDSAINYAWNGSILQLREKVKRFGLSVVQQIISKSDFDESKLLDLKDAELLTLCLRLNLVSEQGHTLLNQCREVRNNFSAAHPASGQLDDYEFLSFLNRCAKYAINEEPNPVGVDFVALMGAIKGPQLVVEQIGVWTKRILQTHDAQRDLIFGTLHGIYCDPAVSENARQNALTIAYKFSDTFTPAAKSSLLVRHSDYAANADSQDRYKASQQFFEKLSLLALLGEHERHSLFSSACAKLLSAHNGRDNFYNEPAFAQRLQELSKQDQVPETTRQEYVCCILTCAVGNQYGTSRAAFIYYTLMIQAFSPAELDAMFVLVDSDPLLKNRIQYYPRCKQAFVEIAHLVNPNSIPARTKPAFERWVKQK